MNEEAQARQVLKAALRDNTATRQGGQYIWTKRINGGVIEISAEAARLIDQLLTKAHYQGELEKAETDNG